VSSSDAASSSASRREGASFISRSADDDTKPHVFAVGDTTERSVPLTKSEPEDRSAPWPPAQEPAAAGVDPAPTSAYATAAAFGAGTSSVAGSGVYAPPPPPGPAPVAPPAPSQSVRSSMARRARLKISHLGPLSVLRISLTFALCMFIVLVVAVAALWAVLDTSGVFKSIANAANTLTDKSNAGINHWLTFGRVMLITVVVGAANVIAFTLLSTIGALLYNLCSDFVGGVEVTLVER
jgi:Transmembrane domain of unknown function (DUF3566)